MPAFRRINLAVTTGVALLSTAVIVVTTTLIYQDKRSSLSAAHREVTRAANNAEASFNRSLLGVDLLLAETGNLITLPDALRPALDDERNLRLLRGLATANLAVRHISVLGTSGAVMISSDENALRLGIELPANFLRDVLAQTVPALSISAPSMSFSRSERVLYMARPIILGKGIPAVVVAEVSISAMSDAISRGVDNSGFEITLERGNGELLASVPLQQERLGNLLSPVLTATTGADRPVIDQRARLSDVAGLIVARPTLYPNLLVAAGMSMDAALIEWRQNRAYVLGGAAGFLLMIFLVGAISRSYLRRLTHARQEIAQSKATVDQALDSMVGGFLLLDSDGNVVTWNQRFLKIHPWLDGVISRSSHYRACLEMTAERTLPNAGADAVNAWVTQHATVSQMAASEHEHQFPDGHVVRVSERRTPDGGYVSLYWDVTERKREQVAVLASKAQLQATIDAIPDFLYEANLEGHYHSYHSGDPERRGKQLKALFSKRIEDLLPPDAVRVVMDALTEANVQGMSTGKQFAFNSGDGNKWFELSVSRKPVVNGEAPQFIVISRDITASRVAAAEIEHLAFYDPLTGLPNRRLLIDRLKQALATSGRRGHEGALLFIDLDNFKALNDTRGHEMGDQLLLQVAERLTGCVRKSDTVARLGGDEFVVILEDLGPRTPDSAAKAGIVSEKVLLTLNQPYLLDNNEHASTVSMGVTLFSSAGDAPDDLVKQADIAMYQAKAAGRNALRFYDPEMQSAITGRVQLERDIRSAITRDQFVLHFQRQVTHDGRTVGAEALIRWPHPTRGMVMPGAFIPIAEETGLIAPIGLWVLDTACMQLKVWEGDAKTRDLQLSINVSAHQFRQANFVELVASTLRRTGARANSLTLELTESVMLESVQDSIEKIKLLGQIGVRFSIDDFGTGHSSLAYLSTLPIAQLKIAQPFVDNIGTNPTGAVIIQTIIGMAQNLGLEVIAEGVETEAQRAFLEAHGCLLCQGYLFGRPVPISEFERSI